MRARRSLCHVVRSKSVETPIRELRPVLIGEDPAGVERHWQRMYQAWRYHAGNFELPTTPGLGTDLVLDVLAERAFRPQPAAGSSEAVWQ